MRCLIIIHKLMHESHLFNRMPECSICFEDEKDNDELIYCHYHQFHIECFLSWRNTRKFPLHTCLICQKPLSYDPRILLRTWSDKILQLEDILIADDLDRYKNEIKNFPYILFCDVVIWASEYDAINIL